MAAPADPHQPFQDYAHPETLVSAPWLSARLGTKGLVVIECDEDSVLYDIGHLPSAIRLDFNKDLTDPVTRDIIDGEAFAALMSDKGIERDDTVVLYGDKANWWAAYAYWVFKLFGHEDVRLLDGGRDAWMTEERDTSFMVPERLTTDYPVVERNDNALRIFVAELKDRADDLAIVDTRAKGEYNGIVATDGLPDGEGVENRYSTSVSAAIDPHAHATMRHGHIPGAVNLPWDAAVFPNSCFRAMADLEELYAELDRGTETVLYSHLGAQSALVWFILTNLIGMDNVRHYDGSWAEWGNMVRMPIER
ncbi:sulfurtransferase [Corynebacterium incognita]|uniref:Sulfurtransferase n=1 Tax=Corynebacterium incognita TaxID=2754725 RepID=A0A7G7CN76_9CORY|nr:sulfurtransferase [Corynebacterium incognita]QNE89042.1 sulfurtransferase [Corynebacterium incognita]